MFRLYYLIFQRLTWKAISVYFLWFHYWISKELKAAKVENHSVSACQLFTQIVGPLFDMFTAAMSTFSPVRFLNMWKPRTGWLSRLGFYGGGLASLPSWLWMVNAGWLGSIKQAVFLPGQPAPYNQVLIQPLLLVFA